MSEIKDRFKELRTYLGLTQQEFAERIGIKQSTYSKYEIGRNAPIDSVFTLICREFGVSEEWLREGSGEMLRQETEEGQRLKALLDDALKSRDEKFRIALLESILRLDTQQLRAVKEYAERYILPAMNPEGGHLPGTDMDTGDVRDAASANGQSPAAEPAETLPEGSGVEKNEEIERMVEDYRRQLLAEREAGEGFSASQSGFLKKEA